MSVLMRKFSSVGKKKNEKKERLIEESPVESPFPPSSSQDLGQNNEGLVEEDEDKTMDGEVEMGEEEGEGMGEGYTDPVPSACLGVLVHRTDRLKTKIYITHPIVKIYFFNGKTGGFIKSSSLPYPQWEETLAVAEPTDYLLRPDLDLMLIFEILDFTSIAISNAGSPSNEADKIWRRIAWGFLKVHANDGSLNWGRRLRLQLLRAPKSISPSPTETEVFGWWKSLARSEYPGSLHVTLKGMDLTRPRLPRLSVPNPQPDQNLNSPSNQGLAPPEPHQEPEREEVEVWGRVPGQPCKIPNSWTHSLTPGNNGAYSSAFSPDGKTLALGGMTGSKAFLILLYDARKLEQKGCCFGHHRVIYSLVWTPDSSRILSASGDCTARLWDRKSGHCVQTFPHLNFVYTALFHPQTPTVVITGGYDKIIRLWEVTLGLEGQVLREVDGHSGYINCVCLSPEGSRLFSADSLGEIKIWGLTSAPRSKEETTPEEVPLHGQFRFVRDIRNEEIRDKSVIGLLIHQRSHSIIVQTRDGEIRSLDFRSSGLKHVFKGVTPGKFPSKMELSACGRLLFCGGEKGEVIVWNASTGSIVTNLASLYVSIPSPIVSISYHPLDYIAAVSAYGEWAQTYVLNFDPSEPEVKAEERAEDPVSKEADYMDFSLNRLLEKYHLLSSTTRRNTLPRLDEPEPSELIKSEVMEAERFEMAAGKGVETIEVNHQHARARQPSLLPVAGLMSVDLESETRIAEEEPKRMGRAKFPYQACGPEELSFAKGDVIEILGTEDGEWWVGSLGPNKGYVPSNYLDVM